MSLNALFLRSTFEFLFTYKIVHCDHERFQPMQQNLSWHIGNTSNVFLSVVGITFFVTRGVGSHTMLASTRTTDVMELMTFQNILLTPIKTNTKDVLQIWLCE